MNKNVYRMAISALLIAIGILIPMVAPIKIPVGPMTFTLASHVAIMIAMFISPSCAIAVALGTTVGFQLAGFPFIVVLRALSHVIWAFLGAYYLSEHPETMKSITKTIIFVLVIGIIHGLGEVAVVAPTFFNDPSQDIINGLFVLVGLGTVLHNTMDYIIAIAVWKVLTKNKAITDISNVKEIKFTTK